MLAKISNITVVYFVGIPIGLLIENTLLSLLDIFHIFMAQVISYSPIFYVGYLLQFIIGVIFIGFALRKTSLTKELPALTELKTFNLKYSILIGLKLGAFISIGAAIVMDTVKQVVI